ncbi:MAG: beta-galactosidase, partial [Planctomycetes bacterium]|nr:beta-galactosidase [Planctomycetota bacterium]
MLFGAAYYPEHCEPSTWENDLELMKQAHVNCLRVCEFAWTRFEPEEGKYDFDWFDGFLEKSWQRGIGVLLCPPLRTLPAWMVEKDPTVKLEREDGVVLEYGSRYSFCINHPYVLERGAALSAAMGMHYGKHPGVLGWHMDNEHGDEPDCHCPVCRKKFQDYCRRRYVTI